MAQYQAISCQLPLFARGPFVIMNTQQQEINMTTVYKQGNRFIADKTINGHRHRIAATTEDRALEIKRKLEALAIRMNRPSSK